MNIYTAACSFPGENARSWGALGEARPGQSSLSAGALRYRVPVSASGEQGSICSQLALLWYSLNLLFCELTSDHSAASPAVSLEATSEWCVTLWCG